MTRLFIDIYLDEDVDVLLAHLLRSRGFKATTTREAGRLGATDSGQLRFAVEHDFAMLTHNRADFESLDSEFREQGLVHPGIFIAVRRPARDIATRLFRILNLVTADEMRGQLIYL